MAIENLESILLSAEKNADLEIYRNELINYIKTDVTNSFEDEDFKFVCEVTNRLQEAEEFQDFIPCRYIGIGQRGRKVRVDGYEVDEVDDSIRLLICDFNPENGLETITKTRVN